MIREGKGPGLPVPSTGEKTTALQHRLGRVQHAAIRRQHEGRGTGQRRVRVLAHDAQQRLRAVACLGHRGDDALGEGFPVGRVGGGTIGLPDLPEFHMGGVVPGRPGQEVPILALAGERVLPPGVDVANVEPTVVRVVFGDGVGDDLMQLIRRRVRLIVLCDAGADPDYGFSDLQNALARIRSDFGAQIEFEGETLAPFVGGFAIFEGLVVSVGNRRTRTYLHRHSKRWLPLFSS